jgi:hypothetical protein
MKTGTTALQSAASNRRSTLLRHGVRYPGVHYNHRREALALFGRASPGSRTVRDDWDRLLAEVNADRSRRILISNEMIAAGDESVARQVRHDLGSRTHVVFTVRSFAAVLPSLWQQYVKSGHLHDFEEFLSRRLAEDVGPTPDMTRHDQGALVSRWSQVFGPENVTVIVVDKREPTRASSSFEALLDLPAGMLYEPELRGESVNRSLSMHEASLLLTVNRLLHPYGLDRDDVDRMLLAGATARMLDQCSVPEAGSRLVLPPWAVESATARSRQYAEAIARTGVRVIGDLAELSRPPRSIGGQWQVSAMVPVEIAAQAVVGALSAGMGRGSNFGLPAGAQPGTVAAVLGRARQLSASVRRRLRRYRPVLRPGRSQ